MKRPWRQVLISLGTLFMLGALYVWFFGFQTMMMVETRWFARKLPVAQLTPRELTDHSVAAGPRTTLAYFGYSFDVPSRSVQERNKGVNSVALRLESGNTLMFTSIPPRDFLKGVLDHTNQQSFRQVYGA